MSNAFVHWMGHKHDTCSKWDTCRPSVPFGALDGNFSHFLIGKQSLTSLCTTLGMIGVDSSPKDLPLKSFAMVSIYKRTNQNAFYKVQLTRLK